MFEGSRPPGRERPPGPRLPSALAADGHEVVLEVGEVGTEIGAGAVVVAVVAGAPQLLARGVDVGLGVEDTITLE